MAMNGFIGVALLAAAAGRRKEREDALNDAAPQAAQERIDVVIDHAPQAAPEGPAAGTGAGVHETRQQRRARERQAAKALRARGRRKGGRA